MAGHASSSRRVPWREIVAVREYRGLFYAQLASLVGDQLAKVALAILVYGKTRSALLAALTYGVTFLPALVSGPLLGVFADTRPRRSLMIVCDLSRAVIVAVMLLPGLPIGALLGLLFAVSALDPPFNAAKAALLPDVLTGDRYAVGQALNGVVQQVCQVVGFGVGGLLVTLITPRGALAVDVVSFLLSAVFIRFMVEHRAVLAPPPPTSRWALISAGAREVLAAPFLRNLVGITAISFAMIIATEGLAVSYAHQLGAGDTAVGLLTAAVPVGTTLGLLTLARVPAERRVPVLRLLAVLWPLPLVATALRPPLVATLVLWALAGLLGSFQLIGNVLFAQALTGERRGRAFAFVQSLLIAVQGVGVVLAGALAELTTPADAVSLMALAGLVGCAAMVVALRRAAILSTTDSSPVDNCRYQEVSRGRAAEPAQGTSALCASTSPTASTSLIHATAAPEVPTVHPGRVYVLAFAVLASCIAAVQVVPWKPLSNPPVHLWWWELVPLFVATTYFKAHFERERDSYTIATTQIVVLLALFFSSPMALLVATIVGSGFADVLRRERFMYQLVNRTSVAVEAVAALAIFHAFHFGNAGIPTAQLAVGMLAIFGGEVASAAFVSSLRLAYDPDLKISTFARPLVFGSAVVSITGVMGLLAVTAMYANANSALLLILLVILFSIGFRSYASLQQRHRSLGRLYAFKEQLGTLVPRGPSIFPVLEHARDLLQATSVTLQLPGSDGASPSSVHELSVHVDQLPSEAMLTNPTNLNSLKPPAAVCVDLHLDGRRLGLLAAEGRLGRIRGFDRGDLKLLETLGAHVSDALERGTLLEQLQLAATHDNLTGLLTLGELMRQLDEALVRGDSFLLALLDVSGLRDVNDSLGHEAGDALLQTLATRLGEWLSDSAMLARSGGGEFAIAIPGVGKHGQRMVLEAIAELGNGLVQVLGVTVELRTRVGWILVPDDAVEAAVAVRRADLALASAKRGVEPIARYMPNMDVDGWRRLRLVNDLRQAIADRELTVAYQPLVTPKNGEVIGAEALVRWTHPELGVLSPEEFVAIAEHSGLIGDLTTFVLDEALRQARRWHQAGRDLRIAINLSARCLTDMSLPGAILDLLAEHRVEPDRVTLEVTETSVAEEPVRALAVLERLRGIGVRLSIDDFGTGYSSLASLKRFPVQEVKLDRTFLADMDSEGSDEGRNDMALISAIVALGHSLDLEIVAEGVETVVAYERLRSLGVDVLQGYFMGKPGPGDELRSEPIDTRKSPEALGAPGSS